MNAALIAFRVIRHSIFHQGTGLLLNLPLDRGIDSLAALMTTSVRNSKASSTDEKFCMSTSIRANVLKRAQLALFKSRGDHGTATSSTISKTIGK